MFRTLGHPLAVHERAVQRAEILEQPPPVDEVDVAVLLRHDAVEDLMGVLRVATERVVREQLALLTTLWPDDGDLRHVPKNPVPEHEWADATGHAKVV